MLTVCRTAQRSIRSFSQRGSLVSRAATPVLATAAPTFTERAFHTPEPAPLPIHVFGALPAMSAKAFQVHYKNYYVDYCIRLQDLVPPDEKEDKKDDRTLEDIVKTVFKEREEYPMFRLASMIWNTQFFYKCMLPTGHPSSCPQQLKQIIGAHFGSMDALCNEFLKHAQAMFAPGFVWLYEFRGRFVVGTTALAETPFDLEPDRDRLTSRSPEPLLCIDMWEHSYMLDHFGDKEAWVRSFFTRINWDFVAQNFAKTARGRKDR